MPCLIALRPRVKHKPFMAVSRFLLLTIERVQIPSNNTEQPWEEDSAEAEEERADRESVGRTQVSYPGERPTGQGRKQRQTTQGGTVNSEEKL